MNPPPRIVIPGGSGFLGEALSAFLSGKGYEVVVLSRSANKTVNGIRHVQWNGTDRGNWWNEIDGAKAVINLTGKSVNCLYTEENKKEILRSRLDSVRAVTEAIRGVEHPPEVVIQGGSLAIFGDTRELCTEDAPPGEGFGAEVCKQWEKAFFEVAFSQTRQVLLRIGFVLGKNGGALEPLVKLARKGLGGTIGSGRQYISWIHLRDMNEMFLRCIEDKNITGILNATGPSPVTNQEFMKTLRRSLGVKIGLPAPAFLTRIGARLVMKADSSLALTGRNCLPARFQKLGFEFAFPQLETALKDLA